jgi:hypothetical protein
MLTKGVDYTELDTKKKLKRREVVVLPLPPSFGRDRVF